MKVAVLVSGNFHPYLRRELLKFNTIRNEKIFEDFDVYYQCWDTDVDRHIFRDIDRDILWTPQPKIEDYDPYFLAKDHLDIDTIKLRRFAFKSGVSSKLRSQGCLQHIALKHLYDHVPKEYDFYIRTRWDSYFSKKFPWEDVLNFAEKNVVGIAAIPNHYHMLRKIPTPENDPYRISYTVVKQKRKLLREKIDSGYYAIIDEVGANNDYDLCRWHNYVKDFCIVFKEEDIEGFNIQESYKNHSLFAAEFGWHQILCRKRSHVNLDGLVSIYRNIDDNKNAYDKLKRLRML